VINTVQRLGRGIRRHGLGEGVRIAAAKLRPARHFTATHIWYELALAGERPRRDLAPEFELREAAPHELELLRQLPLDDAVAPVGPTEARHRIDEGAALWLTTEGDRLAFACWIFAGQTPVWAARGGMLALPPDVACLEDSHASPDFRGRGVAPATWSGLADHYQQRGLRALVTKVAEDNQASRRAVEKAGFVPAARMHVETHRWSRRVRVDILDGDPARGWLASIDRAR
jgi:RimJ/RimL family protein N-acetyltransferase